MCLKIPVCVEHYRKLIILKMTFWLLILAIIVSIIFFKVPYYLPIGIAIIAYIIGRKYFPMKNCFRIYSIDRDYIE